MSNQITRRTAVAGCLGTLATAGLCKPPSLPSKPTLQPISFPEVARSPICVFTKPFNSISFEALADQIAVLGFDGIEAPIRKGGHIEPSQVSDKLPQLVEILAKRNLKITILTSDINDASDPVSQNVLKVASSLGIERYRMKYLKYDLNQSITKQLSNWRPQLLDLAAVNRELGIKAVYQNHAGNNTFGAPLWDLSMALKNISPKEIGVAYDIRHAAVEGGKSWPITFDLIWPHVDSVYVKDFVWEGKKLKNVPLGTGLVPKEFFKLLKTRNFQGPISLHEEYLDHRDPALVPKHWNAIKADLKTLQSLI
ncbi:MAG: sugar phosphate isomerase/epimerase family protein [Pirellulales bacterium]|jgi:sugar phosphate isomerase/epimerase